MNLKAKNVKRKDAKLAGAYMLGETIGQGHYAVVKRAKHILLGEKVAVKIIDKSKVGGSEEVSCLKLVQHPNVVRLLEVMETPTEMMMVMELGENGNLYEYASRHEEGLDEEVARSFFLQIAQAVQHCHNCNVVHRDIKMENIILFNNHTILKLTDFGFSSRFVLGSKLDTSCGSLAYSAPEILIGDHYHAPAVDVWSLGVILFMLSTGSMPFDEATESETLISILDVRYSKPHHINPSCLSLITKMLRKDPEERIGIGGVLKEEWLKEGGAFTKHEHSLSPVEESFVLHRMLASNIATREEITRSLEEEPFNHISACYHLLAGRLVSKRHLRVREQALLEKVANEDEDDEANRAEYLSNKKIPELNGEQLESNDASKIECNNHKTNEETKLENGDKKTENGTKELDTEIIRGRMKGRVTRKVLSGLQEAPEHEEEEEEEENCSSKNLEAKSRVGGGGEVYGRMEGWERSNHPSSIPCRSFAS